MRKIKSLLKKVLFLYTNYQCKKEYTKQSFKRFNERPVEYAFVFNCLKNIYPKEIADIGTGTTAIPHVIRNCGFLVTATDNIKDYWESGLVNRHYYVINDDITKTKISKKFDLITCISVLEHIANFNEAVKNMCSLLKPNGYLILTFPFNKNGKYIPNVYDLEGSSYGKGAKYITQSFSNNELNNWIKDNNLIIIEQEYWKFWTGNYWTIGNQIIPPLKVNYKENHQLTCILFRDARSNRLKYKTLEENYKINN